MPENTSTEPIASQEAVDQAAGVDEQTSSQKSAGSSGKAGLDTWVELLATIILAVGLYNVLTFPIT